MLATLPTNAQIIAARQQDDEQTYSIVRFYSGDTPKETVETGLTLAEAQDHCSNPKTRGTTSLGEKWFDGYTAE